MKGTVSIELATLEASITSSSGRYVSVKLVDVNIEDIISEVGTENILEYMDIDEIVDFINKNQ